MTRIRKKQFGDDAGNKNKPVMSQQEQVLREFEETSHVNVASQQQLVEKLNEHNASSPVLSGGDIDAAWEEVNVGEESVGGENPTPGQNIVEDLGIAVGLTFENNEPLNAFDKINGRDQARWELDPISSAEYDKRNKHERRLKKSGVQSRSADRKTN